MKVPAGKVKHSSSRKSLIFTRTVPVYSLRGKSLNPLFRLAHYSLFSNYIRIRPN